jgi:formylglycine-generating enzyme required for sulfatase activity
MISFFSMRIFLSYASQDREPAKSIYLALRDQGHKVFFDRADLPAGEEYHNRIREAAQNSHLFIFLLSPNGVDAGSYTLEELSIAEKASSKLLPVVLRETPIEQIPASLRAVTFHQPAGNLAAGVAAEVHRIAADLMWKRIRRIAVALTIIAVACAALFYANKVGRKPEFLAKDGAPAVLIPAGAFVMGGGENSPRREIFVDNFYMDKYEVTVGRYAAFLKASVNVKPPEYWETVDLQSDAELPVVGVDWRDADKYCRWAGKRLPTEAEWEKAARGTDERKYPWGNDEPTPQHARFATPSDTSVYKGRVVRVGSYSKGASPFGVYDVAGNVSEWTADWYSETLSSDDLQNPKGPGSGRTKVLRGGGWYDAAERLTTTKRMYASPARRAADIGFRCASNAQ